MVSTGRQPSKYMSSSKFFIGESSAVARSSIKA
jgi:hypothetical protein